MQAERNGIPNCVRSEYTFLERKIGYVARTQSKWLHLKSLMSFNNENKRSFCLGVCQFELWITRMI